MLGTAIAIIVAFVVIVALSAPSVPQHLKRKVSWFSSYDVTDNIAEKKRSGLTIYVDHETGCQYVGTVLGGLTPRIDRNGMPICTEKEPSNGQN